MPNSSKAYPASRMISRSESLPITMETNGCLLIIVRSPARMLGLVQGSCRDVLPIMHPFKSDFVDCVVGPLHGDLQAWRPRGYAQNPASGGKVDVVAIAGCGVKYLDAFQTSRLLHAGDLLPSLECSRISARRDHHANRSIRRPVRIDLSQTAIHRRFEDIDQVTLHAHENRLRLRISEATIELKHHRAARRHHQATIEHTFKLRAFGLHPCDD